MLTADGYRAAGVKGTLGGRGRARTIRYAVSNGGHGQTVVFRESGAFGTHVLGAAKGARGTLRFRPADATGGRRTIGRYSAPGPQKPGRPRGLRARRSGNSLVVSFAPAAGAARYAVTVIGAKGTRLSTLTARHRLAFPSVRREERVTVSVRGLSKKLRLGPARRLTLRPGR
jgi:hypothetical protein